MKSHKLIIIGLSCLIGILVCINSTLARLVREDSEFSWRGFNILAQWTGTTEVGARTGLNRVEDAIEQGATGILAGHSEVEAMERGLARQELENQAANVAIEELLSEYKLSDERINEIPAEIRAQRIREKKAEITERAVDQRMDQRINQQVLAAHQHNTEAVIVCLGESTEDYLEGSSKEVVKKRLLGRLKGLTAYQVANTIIAYEPKWAITGSGSGVAATPEDAQMMAEFIKETIREHWGDEAADNVRMIYGGSAKPDNARGYLMLPDISGLLIGSASKTAEGFLEFIKIAEELGPEANSNGRPFYIGANFKQYPYEDIQNYVDVLRGIDFSRVQVGIAPIWKHIQPFVQATSEDEG